MLVISVDVPKCFNKIQFCWQFINSKLIKHRIMTKVSKSKLKFWFPILMYNFLVCTKTQQSIGDWYIELNYVLCDVKFIKWSQGGEMEFFGSIPF